METIELLWENYCRGKLLCRREHAGKMHLWGPHHFPSLLAHEQFLLHLLSVCLSVSPSLPLYFSPKVAFIIRIDVHHELRMDLANMPSCMWTCLNTPRVKNFLVRISLSPTCHCCLLSSFCAHQRKARLCAPCNPSSGNGRLQLNTHTKKNLDSPCMSHPPVVLMF